MSKAIKISKIGNIPIIPVKLGEDFDYALYNNEGRYIVKKVNSSDSHSSIVRFVVYDDSTTHSCVGDTFTLLNTVKRWTRYRIADKSSPTIEDIKKHLQF